MNHQEEQIYKETRLRNLKRRYAKLINEPSLVDEALETKKLIDELE